MTTIVAFQGESGAFSEAAAEGLVPSPRALLPCATFDDVARAVVNGHADYGVLPVENLVAGPVLESLDALDRYASLERVRELTLPVHLALLGLPGATVQDVRHVLSHPVALKQCTKWLWAHRLGTVAEAHDTAGAARMVAIRRDRSVAAIAATWAAAHYGLVVLAEGLEDRPDNATRFVLVRRRPARLDALTAPDP
ncbi:MAG TPA: prephenate dehydratase domain-containing protein [Gemmatimonadaceae bacterium]|nr:prephenate dehydratase domain-containing protein [Gemmatimonadaceae bacterium]